MSADLDLYFDTVLNVVKKAGNVSKYKIIYLPKHLRTFDISVDNQVAAGQK